MKEKKNLNEEEVVIKKKKKVYPRPVPRAKAVKASDKKTYRALDSAFTYVCNLTNVIEEKTMDPSITDLTLNEIHVIECVNKNNNKKMSIVAHDMNVTVGALITCVNRLCKKGYLQKGEDEEDGRVTTLSVTAKGKKIVKLHDKFHFDILMLLSERISMNQSCKVLRTLAEVLEDYMYPKPQAKKVKKNGRK